MLAVRAIESLWRLDLRQCSRVLRVPYHHLPERSICAPILSGRFKSTKAGQNHPPLPNLRPDASHTDLDTFLEYADRTELDVQSKVYIGTHYEYTVQNLLASAYFFTLTRIAGANDRGVDLLGYWRLPSLPHPIRVLIQCKVTSKLQPRVVRELEGTFAGAPAGWNDEANTLAILTGTAEATKGIRDAMSSSNVGLVWMSVTQDGVLRQMLWNEKARTMGLEGIDVVVRYAKDGGEELRLMWMGKLLPKARNGRDEKLPAG